MKSLLLWSIVSIYGNEKSIVMVYCYGHGHIKSGTPIPSIKKKQLNFKGVINYITICRTVKVKATEL